MPEPRRNISPERKAAYYIGNAISVIGLLLFLSVFLTAALNFGNFDDFTGRVQSSMFRAFGGIILIGAGQFIARIGRSGLAGSGVQLDPEQMRKDLEPWNRAAGGMANDTLEEMPQLRNIVQVGGGSPGQTVVKVRCRACGELNEEDAKFCKACGKPV